MGREGAIVIATDLVAERAEETALPVPRDEGVPDAPPGTWMPTTPRELFEASVDEMVEASLKATGFQEVGLL